MQSRMGSDTLLPGVGMVLWGFGMMGPGMMGRGAWSGGLWIQGLLVLAIGVGLILLGAARSRPTVDESLRLMKQRLARGEITRDQYEELRQVLDRT